MDTFGRRSKLKPIPLKTQSSLIQSPHVPQVTQLLNSGSVLLIDFQARQNKLFNILRQILSQLFPVQWNHDSLFQLLLCFAMYIR